MADNLTFDINAKDNASATLAKVSANLSKMQKNVQSTTSAFDKFRNTLIGLGAIGFVTNTLRWADSIQDLSDATGIATQNILGFSLAVQQNGGTFENAGAALNKFILSIGEAADGSAKTQAAFAKVGVTLEDLRTLSEQDLLQKTIQGLGQISDVATRATIQNELLGKSLRGVNIQGVAQGLGTATKESAKYAESIKNAADTQQNLENSINNLRIALLDVLGPIAAVAKEFSANIETIKTFIKTALTIGAVIASFTLAGRVFGALAAIVRILTSAGLSLSRVFITLGEFFSGVFGASLLRASASFLTFSKNLLSSIPGITKLKTLLQPLIAIVVGAATAFKLFGESAEKATEDSVAAIDRLNKESYEAHKRRREEARAVIDANKKFVDSVKNITEAYKEQNATTLQTLNNELRYMGMTEEQIALDKQRIALHDSFMNTLEELGKKRQEAMADPNSNAEVLKQIDAEIKKVQESGIVAQTESARKIKAYYAELTVLKDLQNQIEDTGKAFAKSEALQDLQDELSLIGLTGDELERQQNLLSTQKTLRQEMQKLSLDLLELENQRTKLGETAYQKERARVILQMNDAQELADAKVKAFEDEQARKQEIENSYLEGTKRALQDLAQQYKPINIAQDAIQKGWSAISSAVDDFVRTGKFKFSDFARSVIADLAAMIIKAQIFRALSGALGIFGIKLPGLAEGGPAKAGQPYIVGENGPELFVPQNSGTVVPNNKMNKGISQGAVNAPVNNTYITNNINALDAKSVAQLFAENRKSLLGSVTMAQREMPYAMGR